MPDFEPQDSPISQRPSAFRRAVLPVTLAVVSVAAMGWLGWGLFETQREDVATTRTFLTHIAAGEHAEAIQLMSPALAGQINSVQLQRMFAEMEPWDHIGFSSRSSQTNGFGRSTQLFGTGETVSGCESTVTVRLHNGLVESFDVTPLCTLAGTDA